MTNDKLPNSMSENTLSDITGGFGGSLGVNDPCASAQDAPKYLVGQKVEVYNDPIHWTTVAGVVVQINYNPYTRMYAYKVQPENKSNADCKTCYADDFKS